MDDAKTMTRKDFIKLTFTLVGSAAAIAACGTNEAATTGAGGAGGSAGAGGAAGAAGAAGQGGAGGTTTTTCTSPLPETQLPDGLGHTHTLTVNASLLTSTTDQVFQTSTVADTGGILHSHQVTLTPANLATIAGGGSVDVQSLISDSHLHTYRVSCH